MAHLLETSIMNLSFLIKHEASNNDDNADKKKQSLEELSDIARLLASWSSKYSPSNISWDEADKQHLTMAEVLKGAVKSIPGENV
tara:strand:- start:18 stop:272 length:255 start_codon:yes stop_codon:yes gene_type:complete